MRRYGVKTTTAPAMICDLRKEPRNLKFEKRKNMVSGLTGAARCYEFQLVAEKPQEVKKCNKCGETKPISEYYSRRESRDGLVHSCKSCCRASHLEYRWDNIEKVRKGHRKSQKRPEYKAKERARVRAKPKTDEFRKKKNAQRAVLRALEKGLLIKPHKCSRCGNIPLRIEAHHEDYTKRLDVEWLCTPCHSAIDSPRCPTCLQPLQGDECPSCRGEAHREPQERQGRLL